MPIDRKIKNGWVDDLSLSLKPKMTGLGFGRSGKSKYRKRTDRGSAEYALVSRFPRYSDDPHQLYVCASISVLDNEVRDAVVGVTGTPPRPGYATIGGNIGLFSAEGSYLEYPLDSEADLPRVTTHFEEDIERIAVPFWVGLSTPEQMLDAIESGSALAAHVVDGLYGWLALVMVVRGEAEGLLFVDRNRKRLMGEHPVDGLENRVRGYFR